MMNTYIADGISARSAAGFRSHRQFGDSARIAIVGAGLIAAALAAVSSSLAAPLPGNVGSATAGASPALGALDALATNDALRTLESSCERGDAVACNDLGVAALRGSGDVPPNWSTAAFAFERSCAAGSPDGCGNLGALYESGAGVPLDLHAAARLYTHACTLGGALACSNLGALYARGRGVERDLDEAQRLFARACQTGSAAGCTNQLQLTLPH